MGIPVFTSNSALFRALGMPADGAFVFTDPMNTMVDGDVVEETIISGEDGFAAFSKEYGSGQFAETPATAFLERLMRPSANFIEGLKREARELPFVLAPLVAMSFPPEAIVAGMAAAAGALDDRSSSLQAALDGRTLKGATPATTSRADEGAPVAGLFGGFARLANLFGRPKKGGATEKGNKVLEIGIRDGSQLQAAFDLLSSVSPRWKALVDDFDSLRQKRIETGSASEWTGGGAFDVVVGGGFKGKAGTYCLRASDRRTELAEGISLQPGASIFALVHELTHAMPLTELPQELAELPFRAPNAKQGSFEELYAGLLQSLYDDEAISSLAEALLYRDMKKAGILPDSFGSTEEQKWLEETLHIYETEGVLGYLQSERYIGRNHRLNYNLSRIQQMGMMAVSDPKLLLADDSVKALLASHGVEVKGLTAKLDVPALIEQAKEFAALASGERKKASASFVGKREEAAVQVRLLGSARRIFEEGRREFEKGANGMDRKDAAGILDLFRLAAGFHASAEDSDRQSLEPAIKMLVDAYADVVRGTAKRIKDIEEMLLTEKKDRMREHLVKAKEGLEEFDKFIHATTKEDDKQMGNLIEEKEELKNFDKFIRASLEFERFRLLGDREGVLRQFKIILKDFGVSILGEWNWTRHMVVHFLAGALADPTVVNVLNSSLNGAVGYWHKMMLREGLVREFAEKTMFEPKSAAGFMKFAEAVLSYPDAGGIEVFFPTSKYNEPNADSKEEDKQDMDFGSWEANFVQSLSLLTDWSLPKSTGLDDLTLTRPNPEDRTDPLSYPIMRMPEILDYQANVRRIRGGLGMTKKAKGGAGFDDDEGAVSEESSDPDVIPTIMHLGELWDAIPDAVSTFPGPVRGAPRGLVVDEAGLLRGAHLFIEEYERGSRRTSPAEEEVKGINDILNALIAEEGIIADGVEPLSSRVWVAAQLAIRLSFCLARDQRSDLAVAVLNSTVEAINVAIMRSGGVLPILTNCIRSIEAAQLFMPLITAEGTAERGQLLDEIIVEYETSVRLRRGGLTPALVAIYAQKFVTDRALRPQLIKLLELAVDHTATFGPASEIFRHGARQLIEAIATAGLLHEDKNRLMALLFKKILPDVRDLMSGQKISARQRHEFLIWFHSLLLNDDVLSKMALFPDAEAVLFERTSALLAEIGEGSVPFEEMAPLFEIAQRLERYMAKVHPELRDPQNVDRLAKVSEDGGYQASLADIYPSRRVVVDINLPPSEWNVAVVRRGLPESANAWERLRAGLGGAMGREMPDEEFARLAKVYDSFAAREIEESGKPSVEAKDVMNMIEAVRARAKKNGNGHAAISGALTAYSTVLGIMSRSERVMLDQLAKLPSVEWGLGLAARAGDEGRAMTLREEAALSALLSSQTLSDSVRKRELFLLVLADDKFPIRLKRSAALGLAQGSRSRQALEALVSAYAQNEADERRLYSALLNFWKRAGQLPDEDALLMLDDEVKRDEAGFWRIFDQVMGGRATALTALSLELLAAAHGELSKRFFDEAEQFLRADDPTRINFVFGDELRSILPVDRAERAKAGLVMDEITARRSERQERLDVIRFDLPAAFVRQSPEIRFLLLSFLKNMQGDQRGSLVSELRQYGEGHSDAEVFRKFFVLAGIEKAGQALSTFVGLVPDEDRAIYAELQDRVPPSSVAEVRRTVERELKKPMDQVFSSWLETPIASASMGEVYRASLLDGTEVLVKVAVPTKQAKILATIATLKKVADEFEKQRSRFRTMFDVAGELRSFAEQLKLQLNFVKERRNGYQFAGDYAIPDYLPDLSTEHVLIMKPAPGIKLTKIDDIGERKTASAAYARDALKMLFVDGSYHADPHPGNQLWDVPSGRLTWIDFGVIGFLQKREAQQIMELLVALTINELDGQINLLTAMSTSADSAAIDRLRSDLEAEPIQTGSIGDKLNALLGRAGREQIYVKPAIMRALAFLITVNGVVNDLDPDHDLTADLLSIGD